MPLVEINNIQMGFYVHDSDYLPVLDGVTIDVQKKEFVAILGPSGCGKSTLLNILAKQENIDTGEIIYNFTPSKRKNNQIAVVWQEESLMPWKTVTKNIEFSLLMSEYSVEEKDRRVEQWIRSVGLEGFGDYFPSQLSQGMRKRVSLAAALITEPQLLLMDEPFSALDQETKQQIQIEVLNLWAKTETTIIFITHDIHEAIALSDRIVVLTDRPAKVKVNRDNPLSRPRDLNTLYGQSEFHDFARKLWNDLKK